MKLAHLTLLISFLVFAATIASAQAPAECPMITVTGPAGQIYPGDIAIFTVNGIDPKRLKFQWTVSAGTIISGSGTPWIKVQSNPVSDSPIIATVEVLGLPDGCQTVASETAHIQKTADPPILDEYGRVTVEEERERLDGVAAEWRKHRHWYLYIIVYLAPKETRSSEQARIRRIKNYLTGTHKIPEERLVFVNGGTFRRSTKIYGVVEAPPRPPRQ